jgi:hypothetical protein
VFYTAEPAELIVFAGEPIYKKIADTQLLYATNTDSWVFSDSANGQIYYLVTGRWFSAPKLEGPWTYAGNDLPQDFQKIPADSEAGIVLASVPGTPEAEDAVLLAQVPTTAVVKRAAAEAQAKVEYNGDPQFAPIEGTSLSYATNANADVIRIEDKYYLCLNAVWFVSSSPTGPWTIVTAVPEVIYTIPPNSPVYHVTYVKVEKSNQEEVVYSYTAGYSGAYIAGVATGAALVWGTGYYYPPLCLSSPRTDLSSLLCDLRRCSRLLPIQWCLCGGRLRVRTLCQRRPCRLVQPDDRRIWASLYYSISIRRPNLRMGLQSQH